MLARSALLAILALSLSGAAHAVGLPSALCGLPRATCQFGNGSFEQNAGGGALPDGWAPYVSGPCDGQGVSATSAAARSGGVGIRVVDRADQCTGFVSDPIPLVGGMNYNASVWVRAAEGTPTLRIFVVWYGNDGAVLEDYLYKDGFQKTPNSEWARLWTIHDAPVDARAARVWVYAPMASAGTFDVDDAAFVSGPPAGPELE